MFFLFSYMLMYNLRNYELMYNYPEIFRFLLYAGIILSFVCSILITISVVLDAKQKGLHSKGVWAVLSFIFGIPVLIIYALFTRKARTNGYSERSIKCLAAGIIIVFIFNATAVGACNFADARSMSSETAITFYDKSGQKVMYDKMGIAYPIASMDNIPYYSKDGKTFIKAKLDNSTSFNGYKCIETNEEYKIGTILIDKDGWAVEVETDKLIFTQNLYNVFLDYDKNVYYNTSVCYWNADGNLIFPKEYSELKDITYDDIMEVKGQNQR